MALNVLIVDDSNVMRAMILKTMRMSGIELGEIYQAGNGKEGLDVLHEQWVDLVLLDINMPVMNGEEMMNTMRDNPDMEDIPVIIISTEGSETRIKRLQSKGASFVHKPFSPEIIHDAIQKVIGGIDIEKKSEQGDF